MRRSERPIPLAGAVAGSAGSRGSDDLRPPRRRGAGPRYACALAIPTLLVAACIHDWDSYQVGTDDTSQRPCGTLADCDGVCVDTDADPRNCGGCGTACDPGETCSAGRCVACPAGQAACDGVCTDTQSDPLNCGDCGITCGLGDACIGGACKCTGDLCGFCEIQDLGSAVPQAVTGDTTGARDVVTPGCVDPGAGEAVFAFTAPVSDLYSIDSFGSDYDTALLVLDLGCSVLDCNDDVPAGTDSQIVTTLRQDETVLIVVDGFEGGEEGDFNLRIQRVACPAESLGAAVPQTVSGSTAGQPDVTVPSCAAPGSPEAAFSFTAPADGAYKFDTIGSSFDTALHIHAESCFGREIACNDDAMGATSEVTVELAAGETVVVIVDGCDGEAGNFTLHVSQL